MTRTSAKCRLVQNMGFLKQSHALTTDFQIVSIENQTENGRD